MKHIRSKFSRYDSAYMVFSRGGLYSVDRAEYSLPELPVFIFEFDSFKGHFRIFICGRDSEREYYLRQV